MSLFGSIQLANNALQASQIGLQVTGNNIANANTPGYIRQRAVFEPTPPARSGKLLLGTGVTVSAIKQETDKFLEARLRGANADLAYGETQSSTYTQLESLLGELGDSDLSTSLTSFFGSLNNVLNQPESVAVRNLAVQQGKKLTDDIRSLDGRASDLWQSLNDQVGDETRKINGLLEKIARLNVQIVTTEGGDTSSSDAVGLRDERLSALDELSKIIDVQTAEQPTGSITVFSGGDYLVFEGSVRSVKTTVVTQGGFNKNEVRVAETDAPVQSASGELAGLIASRDGIVGNFLSKLDELTQTLAYEFNKVHSQGQGLSGYSDLTSEFGVTDTNAALDGAGLPFAPVNGSFQIQVRNKQTGITQTTNIPVDLDGLDLDTNLTGLASAIDAVAGISASITPDNKLRIVADSSNVEFTFAGDTSGMLAALGLNTFFSGSTASDIGVSNLLRADPGKLAASSGGVGNDSGNAELLAGFGDRQLDSQGGQSLSQLYERLASDTAQSSAVSQSVAEGFRVFQTTLQGQQLAISGVNIDEEAVQMIQYQRMFQATAKFISTLGDLLDDLVRL